MPLVVACLGTSQTLAWASSYYLPALLAEPMARDLGVAPATVFGGFSLALVVSALVGPRAGRMIDNRGGRLVLASTSALFALALFAMAISQGPVTLMAAWTLMGLAMGAGLYDAAFAALVRVYEHDARRAITGITLIAGFASTIGWPLTGWLEHAWGWRSACLAWAGLHLVLGLPLNLLLPRHASALSCVAPAAPVVSATSSAWRASLPTLLLSVVFALTWFTSTAMAAHLPRLLQQQGLSVAAALTLSALVGPAQVAARLLEFGLLGRLSALRSARLAAAAHPLGAIGLLLAGSPAAAVFVLLHGAGNGVLTIAKGTLPLAIFGSGGYGARQGVLMAPARLAQAAAPFLFGLLVDLRDGTALWCSAMLGVVSCLALWWLQRLMHDGLHDPRRHA